MGSLLGIAERAPPATLPYQHALALRGCAREFWFSDGEVLEVDIRSPEEELREGWSQLGMERLEQDWDNEKDAVYERGRRFAVPHR